jgi:uncharacterized membrane protein
MVCFGRKLAEATGLHELMVERSAMFEFVVFLLLLVFLVAQRASKYRRNSAQRWNSYKRFL